MIIVPTFQKDSSDFIQTISLGGQTIILQIIYNVRAGYFFLHFTDQEGNKLDGVKMVPNWPLLKQHKALLSFAGDFVIIRADESAGDNITYDNFGTGWQLLYLDETELAAWEAANGL